MEVKRREGIGIKSVEHLTASRKHRRQSFWTVVFIILSLIPLSSSLADAVIYTYDDLNRLTHVNYGSGKVVEYGYDEVGNRTQKRQLIDTTAPVTTSSTGGTAQTVSLTCSDGSGSGCVQIYYTLDGSIPTTASSVYSGPLAITETTTIKYFAVDYAGNSEGVKTYATTYPLSVNKTGSGSGTVTSEPAGINCGSDCSEVYNNGTAVTLTALPNTDSSFTGWSGGGCSGTGTCTVLMNANITISASFAYAGPAEAVSRIRQDCTGYTNCYTSLAAWEAAYGGIDFGACAQGDLVCSGKIAVARIEGAWSTPDTASVVIYGWNTDADHYIRIHTAPEARHNGTWDATKYRLVKSSPPSTTGIITVYENFVRIEGLQVLMNYDAQDHACIDFRYVPSGTAKDHRVSNSILRGNAEAVADHKKGITSALDGYLKAWNNIIYGLKGANSSGIKAKGTSHLYNNTILNCTYCFWAYSGTGTVVKNSIAQGCDDGFYGAFDSSSDYNISDLAADAPGAHSQNSTNVTFVDRTNRNLHLSASDTAAKDAGIDISADPDLAFSDDIDGTVRPGGAAWDIGADEY